MDFERNFKFFKTRKNSYMEPLHITDSEYGSHDQEMQSFDQLLPQTRDFCSNSRLTPIDFERKFDFF
jgi:hypothetical protein